MRAGAYVLLLAALGLAGCDRITGAADQKTYDAQAIGYACRVSLKPPEDCMKENEDKSPSSILNGWKAANKDIEDDVIDPSMGKDKHPAMPAQAAPAAPVEAKPAAPVEAKPATSVGTKPAAATAKPANNKKAAP